MHDGERVEDLKDGFEKGFVVRAVSSGEAEREYALQLVGTQEDRVDPTVRAEIGVFSVVEEDGKNAVAEQLHHLRCCVLHRHDARLLRVTRRRHAHLQRVEHNAQTQSEVAVVERRLALVLEGVGVSVAPKRVGAQRLRWWRRREDEAFGQVRVIDDERRVGGNQHGGVGERVVGEGGELCGVGETGEVGGLEGELCGDELLEGLIWGLGGGEEGGGW